jgi:hypothetical protein
MQLRTDERDSLSGVWIIGNTLLMDGVEACLRELKLDNLVRWSTISADLDHDLKANRPTLIIFERNTPGSYELLQLLKENPGIHLLGIDLECNQVLVMNSYQIQTRTMGDLHQIVQDISGGWSKSRKEGKD